MRIAFGAVFWLHRPMFGLLKKGLLALATSALRNVQCPDCGTRFAAFGGRAPADWEEECACPKCGHFFTARQLIKTISAAPPVNPPGPFEQPPDTRIERKPVSETELLFCVPARRDSEPEETGRLAPAQMLPGKTGFHPVGTAPFRSSHRVFYRGIFKKCAGGTNILNARPLPVSYSSV